jgi:hypothetical protein
VLRAAVLISAGFFASSIGKGVTHWVSTCWPAHFTLAILDESPWQYRRQRAQFRQLTISMRPCDNGAVHGLSSLASRSSRSVCVPEFPVTSAVRGSRSAWADLVDPLQ